MNTAELVAREIHSVALYVEDVATAATAGPGSLCYLGANAVALHQMQRAIHVTCQERGAVKLLIALWYRLRQRGLVNWLRRQMLRGPLLRELHDIRSRLDEVRVGHHPRWGAPSTTVNP